MSASPPDAPESVPKEAQTARSLLDAAAQVFAAQGFHQARVREIAERAGVNVAAISYHYGGKEGLYLAVLRDQAGRRLARYPLPKAEVDGRVALKLAVRALLSRFLADDVHSVLPRLMLRELMSPTAVFGVLLDEQIRPQFEQLRGVVAAVLGLSPDAVEVHRAAYSVLGQCMHYLLAQPIVARLSPSLAGDDADVLDQLVAHVTAFSWAGLMSMRAQETGGTFHA